MKHLLFSTFLMLNMLAYSQFNMELKARVDYQQLHQAQLNDIWGYVDEEGNEYAIVGTTKGTSIVNVTDPENPFEVFFEAGTETVWRDMVTWGDYAYISTEAEQGMLIIDLSPLPQSNNLPVSYYIGDGGIDFRRAHTVFATDGLCFLFGSNVGNGGVLILDIATDPMNPTIVGSFDNWYVHDGYVRDNIMYLAHIYEGFFSLVDITDVANPVLLGTKTTPSTFTHNIWPSDDGNFVFTTDEISGAFIAAYDITDPTAIFEVDRIQSSPTKNVVPHNTHVINDFLVTSYYSDGVTIHDATYPYNLIEVGNYDTYPTQTAGFDGCWGAYPFLPSGTILATDREYGLFVLSANYQKAAYLEGTITDISTGLPIDNVKISITNWDHINYSSEDGFYATGRSYDGVVTVTYEKLGYFTEMDNVVVQNGILTTHDVQMIPIPPYEIKVTVQDQSTGTKISNAFILIENNQVTHEGITNGIGEEEMNLYYQSLYTLTIGKWGYKTKCFEIELDQFSPDITVELEQGYYDDFSFDFGWTTSGTATIGRWVRDIPYGTQEMANPNFDAPWDCGKYAYVTGNEHNFNFTIDEVEDGDVRLLSPMMDLTSYSDPHANYFMWFYNRYGEGPIEDSLSIFIMNGTETVKIDGLKVRTYMNNWVHSSIRLQDHIAITSTMQLYVMTSDFLPDWNIVEAGLDHFYITNGSTVAIEEASTKPVTIAPNPFTDEIKISNAPLGTTFQVLDLNGRIITEGEVRESAFNIELKHLTSGVYLLQVGTSIERIIKN